MQGWRVGDTRNVVAFLSLPVPEPDDQTEHDHNEHQQEDDAQDGACRVAVRGQSRADLGVRVQLLHHEGGCGGTQV